MASEILLPTYGVYRGAMDQVTILETVQDGTTTGFLWAHVPIASTGIAARIRGIWVSSQHSTAFAGVTAPRLVAKRFTFTGTAGGAAVTPDKVDSQMQTPAFSLRTAVTGLTVTLVSAIGTAGIVGALTAVGAYAPTSIALFDSSRQQEWSIIRPGEGVVIYQDAAGTAADTRKANINILWDEVLL